MESDFELFWEAHPRKVKKPVARRAWEKIKPGPDLVLLIIDALEQYKKTRQWQKRAFIPYPATWLNAKQWEDELTDEDFEPEKSKEEIEREVQTQLRHKAQRYERECQRRLREVMGNG